MSASATIPTLMMSRQDYLDIGHILECLQEKETYFKSGVVRLRSRDAFEMISGFDIDNYLKTTKVSFRHFDLMSELHVPGTYSIYSSPHPRDITLGHYFKTYDSQLGTTACDVYQNVWRKIKNSEGDAVHSWKYASDNMEKFSKDIKWINLQQLVEDSLLGHFDSTTKQIEGIFTPYAYYGVTGSLGGIHVEDSDMMSINVNVWGSPKHWLCVSEQHREDVIKVMAKSDKTFSDHPHHYRCKMMAISPEVFDRENIPTHEGYQMKDDIMVTLCGAFHQVVNCGEFRL